MPDDTPPDVTPVDLDMGPYGTPDGQAPSQPPPAAPDTGTPDGTPSPDWREGLPEELATDASLADIKDLPNLVKSFINAQRMIGKDKFAVPGDEAEDADWEDVYNRLGRPETPDEYLMDAPEELPDGFVYNQEHESAMRKAFHEIGLNKTQADKLWSTMQNQAMANYKGFISTQTERLTAEHASLRKEWGDKYKDNLELAGWVAREFGGEEFIKFLNESKVAQEPRFLKVAAAIGAKFNEDKPPGERRQSAAMTPAEAQSKINDINMDTKHPYHNGEDPGHAAAVKKMQGLYMMAYPEEANA